MIAQPILSTPTPAHSQASQTPPASANGFLSLLSPDDSSLLNATQTSGINASTAPQPANVNKAKSAADPTATTTPYVVAPTTAPAPTAGSQSAATAGNANASATAAPASTDPSLILPSAGNQALLNGNPVPSNAVLPASSAPASDASQAATAQSATGSGNGNSTGFGANVDARVAAGAPIYASQPNAAMATVPPHLLNEATPQTLTGTTAKAGDSATQKTDAATNASDAVMPATTANTATTAAQLHPAHGATNDQTGGNNDQSGNNPAAAANAGSNNTTGSTGDTSAASSALATQPNAPASTPVQLDAAVHTPAPYVPVGEQVALNVKQALAADNNEIRIQLKPASLGTIDVKLNLTSDGRLSAVISADRSDTLNMLKQDSDTLQQSLRDAGLNADGNSLSFNLSGGAQSFAQNSAQGGFGRGGGSSYQMAGGDALDGGDTNIATSSQSYHTGSLDIEV